MHLFVDVFRGFFQNFSKQLFCVTLVRTKPLKNYEQTTFSSKHNRLPEAVILRKIFHKNLNANSAQHFIKSVQIRSFLWSVFSRIQTKYGDLLCKSRYFVRMRENTDQKNSEFGHFSSSAGGSPCCLKSIPNINYHAHGISMLVTKEYFL